MSTIDEIDGSLQQVETTAQAIFEKLNSVLDKLGQSELETKLIPGGTDSISGTQARLAGLILLIKGLTGAKDKLHLISYRTLNRLKENVLNTLNCLVEITNNINRVEQQGGIERIDENNFVIGNSDNSQTYPFGNGLINLNNNIDGCLEFYYLLSPAITQPDYSAVSSISHDFEVLINAIKNAKSHALRDEKAIKALLSQSEQMTGSISQNSQSILELLSNVQKNHGAVSEMLTAITEIQTKATQQLPLIIETHDKAKDLRGKIEQHHQQLDTFDNEMKGRIDAAVEGKANLDKLIKDYDDQKLTFGEYVDKQKAAIEALIKRAEAMLGLSTSAGLGDTFKNQANNRVSAIRRNYGIIIASLVGISIIGVWASAEGWNEGKFLIKIAAIIPLGLLVSIVTVTLRKLELAREYYEHKASVSNAVEGYRKLYSDGDPDDAKNRSTLIESTIKEVLRNPTDSILLNSRNDKDKTALIEKFAEKALDTCADVLKRDGKK